MCIQVNRSYQECGHTVNKIIRCALPFYWFDNRVPELPPQSKEPFFDCFKCLDEISQVYRIGCPDCTGQGDVHSAASLVRESSIVDGRTKDPDAYNRVLRNYHSFLVWYIYWTVLHRQNIYSMRTRVRYCMNHHGMSLAEAWNTSFRDGGYRLWDRNSLIDKSADKNLAEQKCRQDQNHVLPGSIGRWDLNESHLSEHRPYLNNVSTAIRRALAETMMQDLEGPMGVRFWPQFCDGHTEEEQEAEYSEQTFHAQVKSYWGRRHILEDAQPPLSAPPRGPDRQTPWEFLEFVPPQQDPSSNKRLSSLKRRLRYLTSKNEAHIPRDDERIRRGRTSEVHAAHERFITRSMHFIYELLAFDSGLSKPRMRHVALYFDSIRLGQWFQYLGNPGLNQTRKLYPAAWDTDNLRLEDALLELCDTQRESGFVKDNEWGEFAYINVLPDSTRVDAEGEDVWKAALDRWSDFYKTYLQIIANAMASHTRVTQEQLDEAMAGGSLGDVCGICMDPWDVKGRHNYPVYIPCGNNHIMCLACFMRLSLEPKGPYTRLDGEKTCSTCRGVIRYRQPLWSFTGTLKLWSGSVMRFLYGAVTCGT